MKKILLATIAFLGLSAATFAQTAQKDPKKQHETKQVTAKAKPATSDVKAVASTKAVTPVAAANAAHPVKHDGTPDMRYKANKNAAKAKTTHLKSDGTPDKRFKENKPK